MEQQDGMMPEANLGKRGILRLKIEKLKGTTFTRSTTVRGQTSSLPKRKR